MLFVRVTALESRGLALHGNEFSVYLSANLGHVRLLTRINLDGNNAGAKPGTGVSGGFARVC
jgi:hypothetical protein